MTKEEKEKYEKMVFEALDNFWKHMNEMHIKEVLKGRNNK